MPCIRNGAPKNLQCPEGPRGLLYVNEDSPSVSQSDERYETEGSTSGVAPSSPQSSETARAIYTSNESIAEGPFRAWILNAETHVVEVQLEYGLFAQGSSGIHQRDPAAHSFA
jgi:hypothetical protein